LIWSIMSIIIEVMMVISGGIKGVSVLKEGATSAIKYTLKQVISAGLGGAGLFALIGLISVSVILTYMTILPLLSNIPLFCPSVTIDVGTPQQNASTDKITQEIASSTMDCWNMYGAGALDPLTGIDPPNPRECRILETFLIGKVNMTGVYNYMRNTYSKNWPFGNDRIFLYCIGNLGNDPTKWDSCNFYKARVYVMFRDKHQYDLLSYGSAVCGGNIHEEDFGDVGDAMVWCVEGIAT
jgi:hypothetical protein